MPIYEYRCERCGQVMERITRDPKEKESCPDCGAAARRAVSVPSALPAGDRGGGGCAGPSGFS